MSFLDTDIGKSPKVLSTLLKVNLSPRGFSVCFPFDELLVNWVKNRGCTRIN